MKSVTKNLHNIAGLAVISVLICTNLLYSQQAGETYNADSFTLKVGPFLGFDYDIDKWLVGGQIEIPLIANKLIFAPNGRYLFTDANTWYYLNADFTFRLTGFWSLGSGLAFWTSKLNTPGASLHHEWGYNIITRFEYNRNPGRLVPYLEARVTKLEQGMSTFTLSSGIYFKL